METEITSHTTPQCTSFCIMCKNKDNLIINKRISLLPEMQSVNIDGKRVKFSNRAFRVLCALLRYNGTTVSFCYLSAYAWPDSIVVKNNLMVAISEIRTNLRHTDIRIKNVRGLGYELIFPTSEIENTKC